MTVAAAQDDLPNEALYPVKTATEDVSLWLTTDPQTEMDMLMELIQLRVDEMIMLQAEGVTPPAKVITRLELHTQQAVQIAAGMEDAAMQGALLQIHTELQQQQQVMQILQAQTSGETSQVMAQTATMLENRIRMVEDGMADPQGFQNNVRNEEELRTGQTATAPQQNQASGTPAPGGNGSQQGNNGTQEPSGTQQGLNSTQESSGTQQGNNGTPQGWMPGTGTPQCLLYATMSPQGYQGSQGQQGNGTAQGTPGIGTPQCLVLAGTGTPYNYYYYYYYQGTEVTPQPFGTGGNGPNNP
jgi:hypothetical protein